MKQVRRGGHAHIEHPRDSKAWDTVAWKGLPGHHAIFDQCAYGATALDDWGQPQPILKPTRIQMSKWLMYQLMSRRCDGGHHHQRLEGARRCQDAENYQEELARHIAHALRAEEGLEEQTFAVTDKHGELEQLTGVLRRLATRHGHEATRIAYRLHRNLGHPRKEVLLKLLDGKSCSPEVLGAIEDLECPFCVQHAGRKGVAPAHLERPQHLNDELQADVMWFDLEIDDLHGGRHRTRPKKVAILVMVDTATRYMAARTVPDEKGPSLQKALEREWVKSENGSSSLDHHAV